MTKSYHHQSNPAAASIRIRGLSASRARYQIAHDLRRGPQPNYVDSSRSSLNDTIIEPRSVSEIVSDVEALRRKAGRKRRLRADAAIVTDGIISFGIVARDLFTALSTDDQRRLISALLSAVAERLDTTIEGLVIHRDESATHAHFFLCAWTRSGMPVSKFVDHAICCELQDIVFETLSPELPGLERGNSKANRIAAGANVRDTLHRTVRELHRDLPKERDALRAENDDLSVQNEHLAAANAELDEEWKEKLDGLDEMKRHIKAVKDESNVLEEKKSHLLRLEEKMAREKARLLSTFKALIAEKDAFHNRKKAAEKAIQLREEVLRHRQDEVRVLETEHGALRQAIQCCIDGMIALEVDDVGSPSIAWTSLGFDDQYRETITQRITPGLPLLLPLLMSVSQIPIGGSFYARTSSIP